MDAKSTASAGKDIARLVQEATSSLKSDIKGAVVKLESAYALARGASDAIGTALVAEELARAWARRKAPARALYYARKSPSLAPERKEAWTTLAKTSELIALRSSGPTKQHRARALYQTAAMAFERAAKLTKDPEDRRWLMELSGDAKRQANPKKPG